MPKSLQKNALRFILPFLLLDSCHLDKTKTYLPFSESAFNKINHYHLDTTLPNGAFIKAMVSTDTTDRNLYIKYGRKNFVRMYRWHEPGENHSPGCGLPIYNDYIDSSFVLIGNTCIDYPYKLILPLDSTRTIIYNKR